MISKDNLKYNGDFSKIVPISDLRTQVIINAICFTKSLAEAALEVGITERTIYTFCEENNLDRKTIEMMRLEFKVSGKKVKKRFNYDN